MILFLELQRIHSICIGMVGLNYWRVRSGDRRHYSLDAGAKDATMALRDRLRPWHGVMLVVFTVGTSMSLLRAGTATVETTLRAVVSGLFGLVIFQFTVGNVWGYAVEYHNAGGSWTDLPFLAPFVAAGVAGVGVAVRTGSAGVGAWAAFWAFVIVAAVVALGAWVVAGYRDAAPSQ
jgi:hypothetical protein